MNGALLQPPPFQTPPLGSSSIKMLRESVRQRLPLHFRVSSASVEKRVVLYTCSVSSVTTNHSWDVSYRYSDFAAFGKKVEEQCTCQDPTQCPGSCEAIREFLWACFPHKRLSILSRSHRVIADRRRKFETVVLYLLRCVLLPGSAMKCLRMRRNLPSSLFKFLNVQQDEERRSLLQVFVDNYQTLGKVEPRSSFESDASTVDSLGSTRCMICLDDVDDSEDQSGLQSVVLPCSHTFHRECIFEWLSFQYHCPMCRARVGPPAVVSYCVEKMHTFQWWLSDFEEDPLVLQSKQG